MKVIASIDQSTTATKGLIWSLDGRLLGRADVPHRQIVNSQGWVGHDPMEILENTYRALAAALTEAQTAPGAVAAIGISNQRETALCWDKSTGKPLDNAIVWQCSRAEQISGELAEAGHGPEIRKRTGLTLSPYFSAAKYAWLIRNVAEAATVMERGNLCCGTMDSWLVYKLCGTFLTDYSNAGRTQLLNLQSLAWDGEVAAMFGIPLSCLPKIVMSDALFGLTDLDGLLPAPVPLHTVLGDSHAALYANQCHDSLSAKATYGTGSSLMMNVGTAVPEADEGVSACPAWGMNEKITYALEGNVHYAGAVIRWLAEDVGLLSEAGQAGEIARSVPDSGGVYLVPAFSGLGAPYYDEQARAAFLGMNRSTTKVHLIRAAEECIAYQLRDVLEAIKLSSGHTPTSLKIDGGPSRDPFLMQFTADILNMPLGINHREEMSGMGAAFCAAIAAGLADHETIFSQQDYHKVEPNMDTSTRIALYDGWKSAVRTIKSPTAKSED